MTMLAMTCPFCGFQFAVTSGFAFYCTQCGRRLDGSEPAPVRPSIDLRVLAQRQRWLLWAILLEAVGLVLVYFLGTFAVSITPNKVLFSFISGQFSFFYFLVVRIAVIVIAIVTMASLRSLLIWRIFAIFFLLIPYVSLLTLLLINRKATRLLRDSGLKVRFMGVRDVDVERLLSETLCHHCGYDLTGNVSGVCSECGRECKRTLHHANMEPQCS